MDDHAPLPSNATLRHILDAVPHPIFIKGEDTRFVVVNAMMCELMGRSSEEMVGKTDYDFGYKEQADIYRGNDLRVLATGEVNENEELLTDISGRQRTVVTRKNRIVLPSGERLLVGCITDISDFRNAEALIRHQADHDALTGLANRRLFFNTIDHVLHGPDLRDYSILVLDLDRFKPVNDLHGHLAGDAVLCQIADRLARCVRSQDLVARLGGDEFGIVLRTEGGPRENLEALLEVGRRILAAVREPIRLNNFSAEVTASIGVAACGVDGADAEAIVHAADVAMYRAKEEGRGTIRLFEPGMDERIRRQAALEVDLRAAVKAGQIVPYFQPLVDLTDNGVVGFEILSRWTNPTYGEVTPTEFIPIAERCGLIEDLTFSLLRQACTVAKTWPQPYFLSLNISPLQLRSQTLPQEIERILRECDFPPTRLEVEITENAIVTDLPAAKTALASLRKLGVRLALDDFGTGYSGLHHLRELSFDKIKIDRSFISSMLQSAESMRIVNAILAMTNSLGMPTVAEGLESEDIAQLLADRGCELGQGFHFGRPMPASDILSFLNKSHITADPMRTLEPSRREHTLKTLPTPVD